MNRYPTSLPFLTVAENECLQTLNSAIAQFTTICEVNMGDPADLRSFGTNIDYARDSLIMHAVRRMYPTELVKCKEATNGTDQNTANGIQC